MFRTILVPTDGSALSEVVTDAAMQFAGINGSRVIAFAVAQPHHFSSADAVLSGDAAAYDAQMLDTARQYTHKIMEAARRSNVACEEAIVVSSDVAGAIVEAAKKLGCDVIFMATHGRSVIDKLFNGSESQRVVEKSSSPVLLFPAVLQRPAR